MEMNEKIAEFVHHCYWDLDINCARTTLLCLGELFQVAISPQVLQSAVGLHGAGGFRAQCGLVEGTLMFLGIYASQKGKSDSETADLCYDFADEFTKRFSSLRCRELRPNGFTESDPPHACERLTAEAIGFACDFIRNESGLSYGDHDYRNQ